MTETKARKRVADIESWQGYWTLHETMRVENGKIIFGSFARHYTRDGEFVEQSAHTDNVFAVFGDEVPDE